jgi:uncharacterized protein (DUF1501 family)
MSKGRKAPTQARAADLIARLIADGQGAEAKGDARSAQAAYQKALALDPAEAQILLRRALQTRPDMQGARAALFHALEASGDLAGAAAELRIRRRQRLFYTVEDSFSNSLVPHAGGNEAERKKFADATVAHSEVYGKAFNLVASDRSKVFEIGPKDQKIAEEYGRDGFGRGCLMARRLVETGVTFVEVGLGGWDTHQRTFEAHKTRLQPELDKGMGSLIEDLAQRGLLEKTLVVWMGDFGRTPRINQDAGRDHWARSWAVAIGGCGIKGGQVIGKTSEDGTQVEERPLDTPDLLATCYRALGIPIVRQYTTPNGRPYWVVDKDANAQPISELIG